MPKLNTGSAEIYYEVYGKGYPVLLTASGGMKSAISFWQSAPWNPIEQLQSRYRVVAMDQRNAGQSTAPVSGDDGWHSYAQDQLALMDHLGESHFHFAGMCIGGPFGMGLIERAPERVTSAVLFQPIGLADDNRNAFYQMFDSWAQELQSATHSEVPEAAWSSFRSNMFDGDFLFNVDREFVSRCQTPLLVLQGNDLYHPAQTSREVAQLAPNTQLVEHWKEIPHIDPAKASVLAFLEAHTP